MNKLEEPSRVMPVQGSVENTEVLTAEVSRMIYENFAKNNLIEETVRHSAHGKKITPDAYTQVQVVYETGEEKFVAGVSVQPRLKGEVDTITPKLYRVYKKDGVGDIDEAKCQEVANMIWEGVPEQAKFSLFKESIDHALEYWESAREDALRLKQSSDLDDQQSSSSFLSQAEKKLREVAKLKQDFEQGNVTLGIGWTHASMGARVE
jgi:hypothetical protein